MIAILITGIAMFAVVGMIAFWSGDCNNNDQ